MLRGVTLPGRAFVRILPAVRSLMTGLYRFDWLEPIVRMHVTAETLIEPPQTRLVVPLGQADAAALAALYAVWPESRFRRAGYARDTGTSASARGTGSSPWPSTSWPPVTMGLRWFRVSWWIRPGVDAGCRGGHGRAHGEAV